MTIENFTPLPAVIGGVLIGLASVWLLVANGRIAGVSGILHGLFAGPAGSAPWGRAGDRLWRAWFIAGLVVAGFTWHAFAGPAPVRQGFGLGWVALAGLLVGFGTRMSGGCTSGHGVCGLGRLSLRSLVAVAIFMAAGMAAGHVGGAQPQHDGPDRRRLHNGGPEPSGSRTQDPTTEPPPQSELACRRARRHR